jgi:hypothetical protein
MPRLRGPVLVGVLVAIPLLMLLWRIDPFRMRVRTSALGGTLCMGALVVLSMAYPADLYGEFFNRDYVSKFARSGVDAHVLRNTGDRSRRRRHVAHRAKADPPWPGIAIP